MTDAAPRTNGQAVASENGLPLEINFATLYPEPFNK